MIYRVLGKLKISTDDRPVELPTGKALRVLAALLLNPNRQLSTAELIRAAWGRVDVDPAQLHKSASSVRTVLRRLGREDDLINHRAFGYELRAREADLDSLQFKALVVKAEAAKARRDTDAEVDRLQAALLLWRGDHPVSNVPDHGWDQVVLELEQRRRRAAVRLFELQIVRRHYDAIVDQLRRCVALYPTDQRLQELWLICLYRTGSAAEAVQAYERFREAWRREAGAPADRSIRDLAYAISNDRDETVAEAETAITTRTAEVSAARAAVPRQLPPARPTSSAGTTPWPRWPGWCSRRHQRRRPYW